WEPRTGKLLDARFPDLDQFVNAFAISPDGDSLVTSQSKQNDRMENEEQKPFHLWDVKTGKLVRKFGPLTDTPPARIQLAADGSVYFHGQNEIEQWSSKSGEHVRTYNTGVVVFTVSADGRWLACGKEDTWIYDTQTGKRIDIIKQPAS